MRTKIFWVMISLLMIASLTLAACASPATPAPTEQQAAPTQAAPEQTPEKLLFGMLLVGPYNDHGWSQAHYDAGLYVQDKLPGSEMIYVDKVNPADRPGTTPAQLAEELVAKGANFIILDRKSVV